ncbi:hypothetical protein ACU4GG_37140 [Streptomyces nojiriensis]
MASSARGRSAGAALKGGAMKVTALSRPCRPSTVRWYPSGAKLLAIPAESRCAAPDQRAASTGRSSSRARSAAALSPASRGAAVPMFVVVVISSQ